MRTYVSPIGYDSRRVTRPVVDVGLSAEDRVILLRPNAETDTERATQAVADVEQLLQKIEPAAETSVERVSTDDFETTLRECCQILRSIPDDRELAVSLGGGARDVLVPLSIASTVLAERIDRTLFFSDLDGSVSEWSLPQFGASIPERTTETFAAIVNADGWTSLAEIEEKTGQSRSTVIRHVNDLEATNVVEADDSEKAKRVRASLTGELLAMVR